MIATVVSFFVLYNGAYGRICKEPQLNLKAVTGVPLQR